MADLLCGASMHASYHRYSFLDSLSSSWLRDSNHGELISMIHLFLFENVGRLVDIRDMTPVALSDRWGCRCKLG